MFYVQYNTIAYRWVFLCLNIYMYLFKKKKKKKKYTKIYDSKMQTLKGKLYTNDTVHMWDKTYKHQSNL